uniref:Uncharacterized protein n=1 Tax=Arundo donax TaxID=35708 RepID=A0A0A9E6I4_ARUDO
MDLYQLIHHNFKNDLQDFIFNSFSCRPAKYNHHW